MNDSRPVLIDYVGTYGGTASRDEVLRALKEAIALVESTARDAELSCAGLRIEVVHPGTPRKRRGD
ncbi:MAG: hypothetical protein ACK2T6_06695 [Anaerolineae bacterium]|jgi:hypothetical protein